MNIDAIKRAAERLAYASEHYADSVEDVAKNVRDYARALIAAMEEEPIAESDAVMLLRRHQVLYGHENVLWYRDRDALLARIDAKGGGA